MIALVKYLLNRWKNRPSLSQWSTCYCEDRVSVTGAIIRGEMKRRKVNGAWQYRALTREEAASSAEEDQEILDRAW